MRGYISSTPYLRHLILSLLLFSPQLTALESHSDRSILFACNENADSPIFRMLEVDYSQFFESKARTTSAAMDTYLSQLYQCLDGPLSEANRDA